MRRLGLLFLSLTLFFPLSEPLFARVPYVPVHTGGVEAVDQALLSLTGSGRLLVIGAHPDDEDTALLVWAARSQGIETAYLSLTRGEGGQNRLGEELGTPLGLLRTEELLSARSVDGAQQFFTRAIDFGYTRSMKEAITRWGHEEILRDVVRVVRQFRPQVIVSIFPPDSRAGHGQHQAAALFAEEAFAMAGSPDAFPNLRDEGLTPWIPTGFLREGWFDPEAADVLIPLGAFDPYSGKTWYQLAMESRSRHRSQNFGSPQPLGPKDVRLIRVHGPQGKLFAGIANELPDIAQDAMDPILQRALEERLLTLQSLAKEARQALSPHSLEESLPFLLEIVDGLSRLDERLELAGEEDVSLAAIRRHLATKKKAAERGLLAALGVAWDVTVEASTLRSGQTLEVTAQIYNGGSRSLVLSEVPLVLWSPERWHDVRGVALGDVPRVQRLGPGQLKEQKLSLTLHRNLKPTMPYFLKAPVEGDRYAWGLTPGEGRGAANNPFPMKARMTFEVEGVKVSDERPVMSRRVDPGYGELREPLRVVPELELRLAEERILWPESREAQPWSVTLISRSDQPLQGTLSVAIDGETLDSQTMSFSLTAGERRTLGGALTAADLPLRPESTLEDPPVVAEGIVPDGLVLEEDLDDSRESDEDSIEMVPPAPPQWTPRVLTVTAQVGQHTYGLAVPTVKADHTLPVPYPVPATATVHRFAVELPEELTIAYVRGGADSVPEAMTRMGVPVHLLKDDDLRDGDLSPYQVIVVGGVAYETRPALVESNPRLFAWVQAGGLLVVQYQRYPFFRGGWAPLKLEVDRPHDRITDEESPVGIIDPLEPLFQWPNAIGDHDWQGWVQERGLYFAHTWDSTFRPQLTMVDPDGLDRSGGLLVAPYGEGLYVYTGLAFFRQLPAGVPGAWRLFSNLLSLGISDFEGEAAP